MGMRAARERMRAVRTRERGFTMIEMMVVIAIIALLVTASTLTLRNLLRSDLRSAARRTAAAMRFAFDRATLTGTYVRLVFDIDKGEIWAEASDQRVSLKTGSSKELAATAADEAATKAQQKKSKPKTPAMPLFGLGGLGGGMGAGSGGGGEGDPGGGAIDVKTLTEEWEQDLAPPERPAPSFQRLKGPGAKVIKLAGGISLSAVMTPRVTDPVEKGKAYVYFFPQGNAEPAIIHFADRSEDYYSVVLQPLSAQARVYPCLYKIPADFGVTDDKRSRTGRSDSCASKGGI